MGGVLLLTRYCRQYEGGSHSQLGCRLASFGVGAWRWAGVGCWLGRLLGAFFLIFFLDFSGDYRKENFGHSLRRGHGGSRGPELIFYCLNNFSLRRNQ